MARDTTPRQVPVNAVVQWVCARRGRALVMTVTLMALILALTGLKQHEAIASRYNTISSSYWRPYLPNVPLLTHYPFRTPSNTTLQLEHGELAHVPSHLKKSTPNFHLVLPASRHADKFCKTTLSAMLLNYPPPTVVDIDWESDKDTLAAIHRHLENNKYVHDEDLVLIVDGENSWFQLPSDVILDQYERVSQDANLRLLKDFGRNEEGYQRFNQTIIFGARDTCEGDDTDYTAKYLDSNMIMGPVMDLKRLFAAANTRFDDEHKHTQALLSIMFAEQQSGRDALSESRKSVGTKFLDYLPRSRNRTASYQEQDARTSTYEDYSIGLDYTHAFFQALTHTASHESMPLLPHNDTSASNFPLIEHVQPPFWRPNLEGNKPSPHPHPSYIKQLAFNENLDYLPPRNTPWNNISLLQNTHTGAIPTILLHSPGADTTFNDLWFSPHKRALLRKYLRATQSAAQYHDSLVGGDRTWDVRGGRGGVWIANEGVWKEWGVEEGICGKGEVEGLDGWLGAEREVERKGG